MRDESPRHRASVLAGEPCGIRRQYPLRPTFRFEASPLRTTAALPQQRLDSVSLLVEMIRILRIADLHPYSVSAQCEAFCR